MARWTTDIEASATPSQLMDVLTDPEAIQDWSPVPFEIDDLDGRRLRTGSTARVSGRLAGITAGFDVEVLDAGDHGLELTAEGPIGLHVLYELEPAAEGTRLSASIAVRRADGIGGRLLSRATGALLAAGALEGAAQRVARCAEQPCPAIAA